LKQSQIDCVIFKQRKKEKPVKFLMICAVISSLLMFSTTAFALGEWDNYTTSYDRTYCFSKLLVESDKELNEVYKQLKSGIKPDSKRKLTEIQREWMHYRDNTCQEEPGTIIVNCNYYVNKGRTEYLRDRLRECKTGNCRYDMIVKKNW
jgi:uncharacterized protein YecT (DUF1311 family)